MIEFLKLLLDDLKYEKENNYIQFTDLDKKIIYLESAIEILEKLKMEMIKNE